MPIILIICLLAVGGAITYFVYPSALSTSDGYASEFTRPRSAYIDGTYASTLTYAVPNNHTEEITVTITLDEAIVVDTTLVYEASNGTSEQYLNRFDEWYKPEVVGKSINDISLSRLGGASLTSETFNRALLDIKQQASS